MYLRTAIRQAALEQDDRRRNVLLRTLWSQQYQSTTVFLRTPDEFDVGNAFVSERLRACADDPERRVEFLLDFWLSEVSRACHDAGPGDSHFNSDMISIALEALRPVSIIP